MKKKVLVLGAVTCVAGIVTMAAAGCSSSDSSPGTGTPDATADVVKADRVVPEASDEDAGQCPLPVTDTAADYEKTPGFKPGLAQVGKCTNTEITTFEKNLDDTTIKTWKDLEKDLSADCAACVITSTAAANWGPIVYTEESGGDRGFYNFGACFSVVEKPECGKSVQFLEWCLDAACDECATTQGEHDSCVSKAAGATGTCKDFTVELQAQCKDLDKSGDKCNNIVDAARTLCGSGSTDGGTDAADDADGGL
jgi:hypothetical protein